MNLEDSFTSFLLQHQLKHKRTLNFLILMEAIVTSAKQIRQIYQNGRIKRCNGGGWRNQRAGRESDAA